MDKSREEENLLFLRLQGKSMHPNLKDGDLLGIMEYPVSSLSIGDIVLFRNIFGIKLVHRIIRKYKRNGKAEFVISGDNGIINVDYIKEDGIAGKVIFVERNGKRIMINDNFFAKLRKYYYLIFSLCKRFVLLVLRKIKYFFIHIIISRLLKKAEKSRLCINYKEKIVLCKKICFKRSEEEDTALLAKFYRYFYWPISFNCLIAKIRQEIKYSKNPEGYFFASTGNRVIAAAIVRYLPQGKDTLSGLLIQEFYTDWRFHFTGIDKELLYFIKNKIRAISTEAISLIVAKKNIYAIESFGRFLGGSALVTFNNDLFRSFKL